MRVIPALIERWIWEIKVPAPVLYVVLGIVLATTFNTLALIWALPALVSQERRLQLLEAERYEIELEALDKIRNPTIEAAGEQ